ncbi:hypothetical protein HMPREF2835_04875 [Actinomyces sp. HMSC072A03]|nr:hypothetical protein HMPREF2835_04875 [Actinomyces sp. HMSC072A03]
MGAHSSTAQGRRKAQLSWQKRLVRMWPAFAVAAVCALAIALVMFVLPGGDASPKSLRVAGRLGAAPVAEFPIPYPQGRQRVRTTIRGSGQVVKTGMPVLLNLTVFSGETGEILSPGSRPQLIQATATNDDLTREMAPLVIGHTEGSRVVVSRPATRDGKETMEITVIDILPTAVIGERLEPADAPAKIKIENGLPQLVSHSDKAPLSPYLGVLVKGDGKQISATDKVVVQYGVWNWSDSKEVAFTWPKGPQLVDIAKTFPGVRELVADQTLGSRLLLVIPAEQATGTDTLIVVVDLLAQPDEGKAKQKDANK